MYRPLVSVIVPIYNTEKYLRECVESLLNQTYSNIEIIVINDGSTDTSYAICKSFQIIDRRIKLYTKENEGQSAARNFGLEKAVGEWICFVDSDDKMDEKMIESLLNTAIQFESDIAMCAYYEWSGGGSLRPFYYSIDIFCDKYKALKNLSSRIIDDFLWNKIFRANLFYELRFDSEISAFEDMEIMHKIFDRINSLSYINQCLYFYRQRAGSSMHKLNFEKKSLYVIVQKRRYDYLSAKYKYLNQILFHSLVVSLMSVYKFCIQSKNYDKYHDTLEEYYFWLEGKKDLYSPSTALFTISKQLYVKAIQIKLYLKSDGYEKD